MRWGMESAQLPNIQSDCKRLSLTGSANLARRQSARMALEELPFSELG
jgi:hypothetical protein